ncbi:MAG: phospholipase C, phosphocholine-specific [Nocardia sp.]|nr:phospholipase C, phosphocholine-specific [Nocardia sp.]
MDRRKFLAAATAGGAAAAFSLLPPSLTRALAAPAPTGGLEVVQHVVIFMQENRSFDHYFGSSKGVRGFADPNATQLRANGKSVFHQPNGSGGYVLPYKTDSHKLAGTPHYWNDGHQAWNKGKWDNWVPAKGAHTMCHYNRNDIPFYYQLADAFTLCDAYHSSVIGSTAPNRSYHISGMIGNEPDGSRANANAAYSEDTHTGYTWKTYPERLQAAGTSLQVFQEWDNFQNNNIEFFTSFKDMARKVVAPLGFQSMNSYYGKVRAAAGEERTRLLDAMKAEAGRLSAAERALFDRGLHRVADGQVAADFRAAVTANRLPKVSWILAPTSQCEHPASDGPSTGSEPVWQVLDALASNETVWNKTVFLLNYDENDGYFDHVPPPIPPASETSEYINGIPIGLGARVPMTVVSPWSRGGNVCSQLFDHTSVLQFLERVTGVAETNISNWRRSVCGDLTATLDTASSNVYPAFARPTPTAGSGPTTPAPPQAQSLPPQEPGTKPARPLPYQTDADATQHKDLGKLRFTMRNGGTKTTHYTVFADAERTDGPWHFDVAPGRSVTDDFDVITYGGGRYDLTCYGPNGFARRAAGNLAGPAATVDVTSQVATDDDGVLWLTLANNGTSAVTFTVAANRYRTDGPWTYKVEPGAQTRDVFHAGWYGKRWYDLTATVSSDPSFVRVFRGYIENGNSGVTG